MKTPNRPGPPVRLVAAVLLGASLLLSHAAAVPDSRSHWAFQPLADPVPPAVRNARWVRTSVDRFLLASMESQGRTPAASADRITLLRRVTYDLTGLPPTVSEVDAFLADHSPNAFERVVDRLLASPHYGEQWGRHWLDVVRYADTAGENTDHPLPHAWRYRNWVIDAFNRDLPYDEFIREQIAGDLMPRAGSGTNAADRVIATGYLAIARRFGHDIDQDIHLTLEDTLDTLGKSVLGLTLGCARCHDHKYDPVTTRDYYALYGIFQSTRFAFPGCEPKQQPRDLVPLLSREETDRMMRPFETERERLSAEVKRLEAQLAAGTRGLEAAPSPVLASGDLAPTGREEFGVGETSGSPLQLSRGEMLQLTVLPKANHGADSTGIELEIREARPGGRTWSLTQALLRTPQPAEGGAQFPDEQGTPGVWHAFDLVPGPTLFTQFIPNGEKTPGLDIWRGAEGVPSLVINLNTQTVRFVTITMPGRSVGVHPGPKGGVAVAWQCPADGTFIVHGRVAKIDPGGDGIAWQLGRRPGIGAALAAQQSVARDLASARQALEAQGRRKPVVPVAYAVSDGVGADARIQKRGDPKDPGDEVPRRFIEFLGGQRVTAGTNGSGRLELAAWLTSSTNPLTARVMVNRIWQHHFGRGLVATPNDFGLRGRPPTHPALLDHLASQFIRSGWSVKAMHRLMLLSAAYACGASPSMEPAPEMAAKGDPGTLPHPPSPRSASLAGMTVHPAAGGGAEPESDYSTFPRRRLTAEEIRDTLLTVTGELDLAPGGPHPFPPEDKWGFTQHGPFSADYDTGKRSVYVMMKRNKRHPFFALFDGADPNASTPVRDRTTVPTQSLFFMNDPLVHARSDRFAGRLLGAADTDRARAALAIRWLYGRPATAAEIDEAAGFIARYTAACADAPAAARPALAWAAYSRVLFASNEFLYLD